MRLHGDRKPHSEPLGTKGGGVCSSGAANEVWSYGPEVYEICKKYMENKGKNKTLCKGTNEGSPREGNSCYSSSLL